MIRLVRVELLKLRTARLTYGLLATGAGLTALFCLLEAARSGPGKVVASLNTSSGLTSVVAGGTWRRCSEARCPAASSATPPPR
jgi:hypothetical protein